MQTHIQKTHTHIIYMHVCVYIYIGISVCMSWRRAWWDIPVYLYLCEWQTKKVFVQTNFCIISRTFPILHRSLPRTPGAKALESGRHLPSWATLLPVSSHVCFLPSLHQSCVSALFIDNWQFLLPVKAGDKRRTFKQTEGSRCIRLVLLWYSQRQSVSQG